MRGGFFFSTEELFTEKIKLTLIIIPLVIPIIFLINLINSYDFAPSTTENQFGIHADLAYFKNLPLSCPVAPCEPFNTFGFRYTSEKPVQVVAYNICGGIFCIKREGFVLGGGGETLGEIPWKVGDTVHIRVKVKPVIIGNEGEFIPQDKIFFIDVGESKIKEIQDNAGPITIDNGIVKPKEELGQIKVEWSNRSYIIGEEIKFSVSHTDTYCYDDIFAAKIESFDYGKLYWQEEIPTKCTDTDGVKVLKADFPSDKPIFLDVGTYVLSVRSLQGVGLSDSFVVKMPDITYKNEFPINKENKIDLANPFIPKDNEGRIDYDSLVELVSKPLFEKILSKQNVEVASDNIILMHGPRPLIYTEYSGICGYAIGNDSQIYWLESFLNRDTLTKIKVMDENPDPCKPSYFSCFCDAQTHMLENTLTDLSYFDEAQEVEVGKIFTDYLNQGGKVTNVPNSFVVGKYNLEVSPNVTSFCGQFQGKFYWHFVGYIKNSKISSWGLESNEKPKLCAIKDNPQIFTFEESAIVKDSFTGQ